LAQSSEDMPPLKPALLNQALVRPQDFVWLLLFGGLAIASPVSSEWQHEVLALLGIFQLTEPRVAFFSTRRGTVVALVIKLLLGFLLIGLTGGIVSQFHLILLFPIISAATTLGMAGTLFFTFAACGLYLVFLHPFFFDVERWEVTREGFQIISLRLIFLPAVSFLTYQLAESNRVEARRAQAMAEELIKANRSLQEAEAAMRRSERLAALGQMSAGLAHELRNPLGTVKASAEMLAKQVPAENEVAVELAGFISSEVDRTNSLISRFLDFARPLKVRPHMNDLTEVLDRAIGQLERHTPPFPVTIYKNYSPDIPPFAFDAELLERVVYNLVLNAAQASPAGSAVTVKTRPVAGYAEFSVIDRGSGIELANRESIFNPFFTTTREGVGLGLAIVAKIVDEHHGKITVESEAGVGSVFRVLLPLDLPETSS
jgi:two-component system sensor histidine kinase HydH